MSEQLYRIGDVAKILGINTSTLRFWEAEFSQIRPKRTDTGQRYYREKDVKALKEIHALLHSEGMTIQGAKKILKNKKNRDEQEDINEQENITNTQNITQTLTRIQSELQNIRHLLNKKV